ncbi:MAG: ABC transporter ATP-binding protein, partial [Acidaminobacteraceae bacterium]
HAVKGVSFIAKEGQIFGLLGPNGAGKTTTLRCISTLIKATDGSINVNGFDVIKESRDVRKSISFLTNELKLDGHFTPNNTLDYFGSLYGMGEEELKKRKLGLFHYFGITDFRNTKIADLSTGMKQKLSIAVSLIHDPAVVIFDEPTIGLDIITARAVTDYLLELRKQGKTIIISTHIMSVASKLCDEIAIILDGEIKIDGTLDWILESTETENLEDAFFKVYSDCRKGDLNA